MKLYLSSYRIPTPQELFILLSKPPTEATVAIIPNAKDSKLPDERAQKLDDLIYDLAKFGFKTTVIDLRDYDSSEEVLQAMQGFDMVWLAGGNTFVLRYEMQRSGFDQVVRDLLEAGVVYAGESAGAIVAGPTLKGFEVADDPEEAEEVIWDGLNLTPVIIAPHADNPSFIDYLPHMQQMYKNDDRVVYLNDDEAYVINS